MLMSNLKTQIIVVLKQVIAILFVLLTASCTWVKDDPVVCPSGFWLNLHYTYNMLDVDAAPEYLKDVSVFVYDADGNYVTRIDVPQNDLAASNYSIQIEGLTEGDYQFVVWSGNADNHYAVSGDRMDMDAFRLSLAEPSAVSATQLPDLYYGCLSAVHYDNTYATHDVFMMKDNNQLSCLIVPMSQDVEIAPGDYTMKVVSDNGMMDATNSLVPGKTVTYAPFVLDTVIVNDKDYGELHGLRFGITTLRLMEHTDCRLILEKTDSGEQVFNVSFPQYVGMIGTLYTKLGSPLSVQEYLDRQDFFTVVFFLSADLDQLIQLQVNSWRLRANNHLKL